MTLDLTTNTSLIARTRAAIAQITDQRLVSEGIDLTNCDREPIHIPSEIQPHGVMLILRQDDNDKSWQIIGISQNTADHLGISPELLLDKPLSELIDADQIKTLESCLDRDFEAVNPLQIKIEVNAEIHIFAAVCHRSDRVFILELEPIGEEESITFFDFHSLVKRPISRIQQTTTLSELCEVAVQEIQQITDYDRVMIYQFAEDESGSVITEFKRPEMESFLGLHYPATDIPKQAKYLYILNLLRIIPDITYQPVALMYAPSLAAEPSVDMSLAGLRSVSPLHVEYLSNMGVRATMAISLVRDGQLWGLLVCHHNSPKAVSYERRTVCEFLGQVVAIELNARANNEDADYKLSLKALQASFVQALSQSESPRAGLIQNTENLMTLTGSTGVAFSDKDEITLIGNTPELSEIVPMIGWLEDRFDDHAIYHTTALSEVYPPAKGFAAGTSGLLALAVSKFQHLYVLWFRPEVLQTVNWAGNPDKPVDIDESGALRMSPRQSFERWQQTIKGRSLPWKSCEIEAALELRGAVIGLVLQKADELSALNSELTRSNIELDSFAYIASHDLKEPLRGIHNYSSFLIEDYGSTLGDDGVDKLNTLMRLTQRMEDLISSLLHYSRLGRAELDLKPVDLNQVVDGVIEVINISQPKQIHFDVMPLPVFKCDRPRVTELFMNLITNGIKYNSSPEKRIEIGYSIKDNGDTQDDGSATAQTIFYVRDNGIGIREKHLETIFRIFKRLHAPKRFGGGTGAGLTIAKKIVERHGGQIRVSSTYGEGSTFYFTLEAEDHA